MEKQEMKRWIVRVYGAGDRRRPRRIIRQMEVEAKNRAEARAEAFYSDFGKKMAGHPYTIQRVK